MSLWKCIHTQTVEERWSCAFPASLLHVSQEVSDPQTERLRHSQLRVDELWHNSDKCQAEVNKEDPDLGSPAVHILEDEVQAYFDCEG